MTPAAFRLPTRVVVRPGCVQDLPGVLQGLSLGRVLLLLDQGVRNQLWVYDLRAKLAAAQVTLDLVTDIESDPRTTTAEGLAARIREQNLQGVVSIGGGSVIDAGKAAAMLAANPGSALDYEGRNRFSEHPLPFVAVPTTCGTGSEVTWVSVLTDEAGRRKISVKGDGMFPTVALVDADLLASLPAHFVAYTGLDALTHALEATIGRAANPVSDALAEKAISLLFQYLPRAVANIDDDAEARTAVMQASTLAGMAFGNADVGGVHCLSESLGALYHVPHGLGNAILLGPVMQYHLPHAASRFAALAQCVWPAEALDAAPGDRATLFLDRLLDLGHRLEIPPFATLDVPPSDYPHIAELAVSNNSNDANPQVMAVGDYLRILQTL